MEVKMKSILIHLENEEYEKINKKRKRKETWKEFIMRK
jgi:hypothetical protein